MANVTPILGYKEQPKWVLDLVNHNKVIEEINLRILDAYASVAESGQADGRWLEIGRDHFEQAWMAINRAFLRPERVGVPTDLKPGEIEPS